MGLATLLKRRLGRDEDQGANKRRQSAAISSQAALDITPEALAALKAKNTRTARRKLAKLGPLADEILARAAAKDSGHGDGAGSDDEGFNKGAVPGAGAAYDALLASLASGSDAVAEAYQQRRRELDGYSDESESDADEEDGEGTATEEEEGSEGSDAQGSEELGGGVHGGRSNGKRTANGRSSNSEVAEEEVPSEDSEGEEEEDGDASEDEAKNDASAASAFDSLAADRYAAHFEDQISEDEVAALAASTSGTRTFAEAPSCVQEWKPEAVVQVSEGGQLPDNIPTDLRQYGVKERLATRWKEVHGNGVEEAGPGSKCTGKAQRGVGDFVTEKQRALFGLLTSYADVLHPCRPYPTSPDQSDPELDAVLLHILNHVARAADTIKRNNQHLAAAAPAKKGAAAAATPDAVPRDQGFTRPKVLVLLPMRNVALRFVQRLLTLALRETRSDTIQQKRRFLEEFGSEEDEEQEADGGGKEGAKANGADRAKAGLARKPAEHRALFHGNLDDHFRVGIKLTRGAAKLYADFFQSDIIVASPLALATKLEEAKREKDGAGAADFLSSIEVVVVDRADVLLMQNWAHVQTVLSNLNRMPSEQHGVDIMRVREWYLAGQAKYYRQTILMSSFVSAEMNALLGRVCANRSGVARLHPHPRGVLGQVVPQARQIFEMLPTHTEGPAADADRRFEHFKAKLWPRVREAARGGGQLIYIPSYFDYTRVRNFLRAESASFLGLCEYTERSDMARARSYFADGRRRVLLYTERAQFYNRHRIRGVKDILFYQLPEHPQYYLELTNLLEEESTPGAELASATVVYSRFDALRLERVVGADRARTMLKRGKKGGAGAGTFLFC